MKKGDKGNYSKKHPPGTVPDKMIVEVVRQKSIGGEMSCAAAFKIAEERGIKPAAIGLAMDSHDLRIVKCQMGLFGYRPEKRIVKPAENISPSLETAIRNSLVKARLPCLNAWEIAERFEVSKMQVASACEALKIKISACQLGAF